MDQSLSQDEVILNCWNEYKKTREYSSGAKMAIPEHHPIIEKREEDGLRKIYVNVVKKTSTDIKSRTIGQWLTEWKYMNTCLNSLLSFFQKSFILLRYHPISLLRTRRLFKYSFLMTRKDLFKNNF